MTIPKFKITFFLIDHSDNDIPKYTLELVRWHGNKVLHLMEPIEVCFDTIQTMLENQMKINKFHDEQKKLGL